MLGVAASNNWAIAPQRSRGGKSLLANDTHLPLSMPSLWNFVQIRSPKYQAAGVSLAGVPAVVAGYNGKLAWGMTMVMGDNQDIYLERIKREGSRLMYQADGKWLPVSERQETFFIKGQRPIRETLYETRNGPLLNSVLGERKHMLQPLALQSGYGLALKTTQFERDQSLDAFFDLSRAQSVDQAFEATREIRAMPLNIVFADAPDLQAAAEAAASAIAFNQGEVCTAGSRLLVENSIKDKFVPMVVEAIKTWNPGNPLDPATNVGALVDTTQMNQVLNYIQAGHDDGAKLVAGGKRVMEETGGTYVEPTIFDGVNNAMRIAKEEIFGPVLSVIGFDDEADAVAIANDTIYGLAAGIWTSNLSRAHRVGRAVRAGSVWINQYDGGDMTAPFGGFKQSGNGRDKSLHAFDKYTEIKATWIKL